MSSSSSRLLRLVKRTRSDMTLETQAVEATLSSEERGLLSPFLKSLGRSLNREPLPDKALELNVFSLCVQAPPELFHAAGLPVARLACGSFAARDAAPQHLPALACPMIKSLAGLLSLEGEGRDLNLVIPTTCDWVVKFAELTGLDRSGHIHFMELPHLRESETASRRWIQEINSLKSWIENLSGRRISPKQLLASIRVFNKAAVVFEQLLALRRDQGGPGIHFALILNAFGLMNIEAWTGAVHAYIRDQRGPEHRRTPVFLSGSPVVFPNYKMIHLIENAGMYVAGDDVCTLERAFPGATAYKDRSAYSLVQALADRHHKACICPTFADNYRRMDRLVTEVRQHGVKGVIFHVLKGCHPYDMEAGLVEQRLKQEGIRYLKIETDYVKADEQNIVTRLEAFSRSINSDIGVAPHVA